MYRNHFKVSLLLGLLITLISACSSTTQHDAIYIADNVGLHLTPPPNDKIATTQSHLVAISLDKQQHQFIAQVEYTQDKLVMVGVSPQGLPLFDFTWQYPTLLKVNQYLPLPNFDVSYVVADMQLCHWPLAVLRSAIEGKNITIEQKEVAGDEALIWRRIIKKDGQNLIIIEKGINGYHLNNLQRKYQVNLTNLAMEAT